MILWKTLSLFLGCTYGTDELGLYANSREEYWSELYSRLRTRNYLNMTQLVEYIDIWDVKQQTWYRKFYFHSMNQTMVDQLFR